MGKGSQNIMFNRPTWDWMKDVVAEATKAFELYEDNEREGLEIKWATLENLINSVRILDKHIDETYIELNHQHQCWREAREEIKKLESKHFVSLRSVTS